ncbi:MAG TPA: FHA domain-containing protein [Polyangiaceae bacterium]|nr:FHA domain-containing protein [Polyangiaceae bacterium]
MARYRLRFLLQEFDLALGSTVIGRSLDCTLTIEDPLVSRQHARIVIAGDEATVEDMASRNGVRVNGVQIKGATPLRDGDRVRIGTQDFVFCRVDPAGRGHSKTTGVLRLCAKCRLPYPRVMLACPNCEATEQTDEETLSGSFGTENQTAWSVQLLVEALERALTLGRVADAERIARRATAQVEELAAAGGVIDAKALAALAVQAVATTLASNDPTWAIWVMDIYRRTSRVPPLEVVEHLAEAAAKHAGIVSGSLEELLMHLSQAVRSAKDGEIEALARLEQVRRAIQETAASRGESETTGEWPGPS